MVYPPSFGGPYGTDWSAQASLLPYVEQGNIYDQIDFTGSYKAARTPDGSLLGAMRVPTLLCPSEIRDIVRRKNGVPVHYPLDYGVNLGIWFVYDLATQRGGKGAFMPFRKLAPRDFQDGLSQTLVGQRHLATH